MSLYNMLEVTPDEGMLCLRINSPVDRLELLDRVKTEDEASIWYDLFEPYFTNGSYQPINAEDIGALTSDPYLIAEEVDIEDDGTVKAIGKVYHCPNYMTTSVIHSLIVYGHYNLTEVL